MTTTRPRKARRKVLQAKYDRWVKYGATGPDEFERLLIKTRLWWGRQVRQEGVYTDFGRNYYRGGHYVLNHFIKEYRAFKRRKKK